MKILGLNTGEINSSAALLNKGEIISAVQEERLNRLKFTRKFPLNSIKYCLNKGKIKITDLDVISVGWNPSAHMIKYNPSISEVRTLREYNLQPNKLNPPNPNTYKIM